jgi:hypothetical protein
MGVSYNPSVVADGLILLLDAASNKSIDQAINSMQPTVRNHTGSVGAYWSGQISSNNTEKGLPSFKVTTVNNTLNDGFIAFGSGNLISGLTYTWSIDVWVPIGKSIQVRMRAISGGGAVAGSERNIAGEGEWVRYSRTFVANTNSSGNIEGTEVGGPTTDVFSFWIRNLQLEQRPYANPFVDGTAYVWADLFGNGRNIATGGLQYLFNRFNLGYFKFNGTNSRVDIPPENFNLTEFTINLWFNSKNISGDYLRLIQKADTTEATSGFLIAQSNIDGKLVFVYQPTYTTNEIIKRSTFTIEENIWYFLTMTYSQSSGIRIYFNGVEDLGENATSPDIGWTSNTGNLFSIGSRAGGTQVFDGEISKVSIYQRELQPLEILKEFDAFKTRFRINNVNSGIVQNGLVLNLDAFLSYSGTGTTWFDLSGNGRNATINGSPTFENGYFDITSDTTYISLSNSGLVPRTNDFTYSCWINFDAFDANDTIFENGSWTDTLLFRHQNNTGIAVFAEGALRGTFDWVATSEVWYNIVFIRQSNIASCYINNVLTGTPFSMNVDINLANQNLWLMRSQHTTNQFIDGKIAIFSIYNRALTQQEIQQNFNAIRGRFGI